MSSTYESSQSDRSNILIDSEVESFRRGAQNPERLMLSLDRKVSPEGWYQDLKDRWVPTIPNSFGLPAGKSCPGKTAFCVDCYAVGSENGQGVEELVNNNFELLQEAGTVEGMEFLLVEMVDRYKREAERKQIDEKDKFFRIHWDGDFFSEDYAKAWAKTIRTFPYIKFWAYTRSFVDPVNVVPHLTGIDNFTLYLSTDKFNVNVAHEIVQEYPDTRLAPCAEDYRSGRELSLDRRTMVCPENAGRIALMDNGRGACTDCRLCIDGKADILFSTKHTEDTRPQLEMFPESVPVYLLKRPALR